LCLQSANNLADVHSIRCNMNKATRPEKWDQVQSLLATKLGSSPSETDIHCNLPGGAGFLTLLLFLKLKKQDSFCGYVWIAIWHSNHFYIEDIFSMKNLKHVQGTTGLRAESVVCAVCPKRYFRNKIHIQIAISSRALNWLQPLFELRLHESFRLQISKN